VQCRRDDRQPGRLDVLVFTGGVGERRRGAATDRDLTRPSRGTDRRPAQQRRRTGHRHQRS
jgi:hypothetical protein